MGWWDAVEVAVIPVLLGGGVPLLPHPARDTKIRILGALLCLMAATPAGAVKVHKVSSRGLADVKVYVTDSAGLADCIIYVEDSSGLADGNAIWYYEDSEGLADVKVYFEKSEGLADKKIFFTTSKGLAKCDVDWKGFKK
ncbi:MAG: DUF6150 family protein [Acidobacteriota bacterium]